MEMKLSNRKRHGLILKYASTAMPFLFGLLALLYILLPVGLWGQSPVFREIETRVVLSFLSLIVFVFFLLRMLVHGLTKPLQINSIDIVMLLLALYYGGRYMLQYNSLGREFLFGGFALFALYILFRHIPPKKTLYLLALFPLAGIVQIIYGIITQTGYFAPGLRMSDITGIFFNTGIFGGFMALSIIVALGLVTGAGALTWGKYKKQLLWCVHAFFFICIAGCSLQLYASNSRAAWLACLAGGLYLAGSRLGFRAWLMRRPLLQRSLIILTVLVAVFATTYSLYSLKTDSAKGRVLIWQVSLDMIKDKPLLGLGINSFQSQYMNYQAVYFEKHPASPFKQLAADNSFAFNEFIRFFVEQGALGGLLMLALVWLLLLKSTHRGDDWYINSTATIARAAILTLVVFGLFSYPLAIFRFKAIAVVFIALVANNTIGYKSEDVPYFTWLQQTSIYKMAWFKAVGVIIGVACIALLFRVQYQIRVACKKWEVSKRRFIIEPNQSLTSHQAIYPVLGNNPAFLSDYAKMLRSARQNEKALLMFERAIRYQSSYEGYIGLGKSYQAVGNYKQASDVWLRASFMVPSKFTPKYLLAKMLYETGQPDEAAMIARELLRKEIKISDPQINDILYEMREIIKNKNKHIKQQTSLLH